MSDLWDSLGQDINKGSGDNAWLYRVGKDTHGPLAQSAIIEKWLAGELTAETPVARQGTDFAPLGQVAAFAAHRDAAEAAQAKRSGRTTKGRVALAVVVLLAIGAGAAYMVRDAYNTRIQQEHDEQARLEQEAQAHAAAQAQAQAEAERQANVAHAAAHSMKLVALVSLGSMQDVKITEAPKKPKKRVKFVHHKRARGAQNDDTASGGTGEQSEGPPADDSVVESCQLSQQDIFSTLRGELAKLNVCVEDEKRRDDADLLPKSLELQFVVKQDGKVVEFVINDRHFRTGALNNCLVKAFKTIRFKQTQGANCPVTIPIKIGS